MRVLRSTDNKRHVSPLRYPGGKTCLVPFFENILAKNKLESAIYVEPYAGGAGAALALLYSGKVKKIVINDLDRAVFAFWNSATKHSKAFIQKVRDTPVTVAEWKRQRRVYQNKKSPLFDLGFATFYLNRTNVSGIMDSGPIGGHGQSGKYKIGARYYKNTLIARLEKLAKHAKQIKVTQMDGIKLAKQYLSRENTLVYLDPPYLDKGYSLYWSSYKVDDHEALADLLNEKSKSKWLLTYDSKQKIRKLYPERRVANFSLDYRAYEVRKGREILILSDSLKA